VVFGGVAGGVCIVVGRRWGGGGVGCMVVSGGGVGVLGCGRVGGIVGGVVSVVMGFRLP
jgi:hypothetical protein